jgi:wyosine [tRNA(Phe)-imidazoG37] synthetase (radical SAM superfamily)
MDRDAIIRMAIECQLVNTSNREGIYMDSLEAFAKLVADAEAKRIYDEGMVTVGHMREQVAKECERVIQAATKLAETTANELIAAEREAIEKTCTKIQKSFFSTKYAVGQPLSSFKERFAVGCCLEAIRARGE